ncbi:MAG: hypothetical protein A2W03_11095 [Candidatus Aminicenantes bacterium RBG_16_63_16]|nr:MAG: hypothetical protein A2W03_11095 [Candidatus Aminicenantes bacterium RBG_16_63_16]
MTDCLFEKILGADKRIRPAAVVTPLERSMALCRLTGADVHLKWETRQVTGSFKFRGALNKIRSLSPEDRRRGAVTASTGNHGLASSLAARLEGLDLTLVLPARVSAEKRRRLAETGTKILEIGETCEQAEMSARKLALETGRIYISPYNDEEVIAGQGTIGVEIASRWPRFDTVLVPVGGGGLACGVAGFLKAANKSVEILGVEPAASAFMAASLEAGRIVEIEEGETIADAVTGGLEPGSITFSLCQELLDGIITVGEDSIRGAMALLFEHHAQMVEGAGALPLAAVLAEKPRFRGRAVVLVVSGGNVSPGYFR